MSKAPGFPLPALTLFLAVFSLCSCVKRASVSPTLSLTPPSTSHLPTSFSPCDEAQGSHFVFSVSVDGEDVGREVLSVFFDDGPLGTEKIVVSHLLVRMRMGKFQIENREVRVEKTSVLTGSLIEAAHNAFDQVKVRTSIVYSEEGGYKRIAGPRDSVDAPVESPPIPFSLPEGTVIGHALLDVMRPPSSGPIPSKPRSLLYYEPALPSPVEVTLDPPIPGSVKARGRSIEGHWVFARRSDTGVVVQKSFFDHHGNLIEHHFPNLHQVRRLIPGPLSMDIDTSELIIGLYSRAYIGDPTEVTQSTYLLQSTPDRLDALAPLLSDPENQSLVRTAPDKARLIVVAGSPDGTNPPTESDLGSSLYIRPEDPSITDALAFLKSGGKRGSLSEARKRNTTQVVARAGLIQKTKAFWSDPDNAASLIMEFVHALLPDKRHTFSMSDAPATLSSGSGDCTEHAVLFASFMRALKIPTRLVAGLVLYRGGMWGYHMWSEYWNGFFWRSIDPSSLLFQTGSTFVAIGRGASRFVDIREDLSNFIWRTFSGVSFDLISASSEGEKLTLSFPRNHDDDIYEVALFNAAVLSERGDHTGALDVIDKYISEQGRSLKVKLMRIELLVRSKRYSDALEAILDLRGETSRPRNVHHLDRLELQSLLAVGNLEAYDALLDRLLSNLDDDSPVAYRLKADSLYGHGKKKKAVSFVLTEALARHPDNTNLLNTFVEYVCDSFDILDDSVRSQGLLFARRAVNITLWSDPVSLSNLARISLLLGLDSLSSRFIDHAMMLSASDVAIHELRARIAAECAPAAF